MKPKIIIPIIILGILITEAVAVGLSYARSNFYLNAPWLVYSLNLPLASLPNASISYRRFVDDYNQAKTAPAAQNIDDSAIRLGVWNNLVYESVVSGLLQANDLKLNQDDVQQAKANFLASLENEENLADLKHNYNLTPGQAADRFIRPMLEEERLRRWYTELPSTPERQQIDSIINRLKSEPENFQLIASSVADSETVTEHVVPEADLQEAYAGIAQLDVGQISSIIASPDGYRLYRVNAIVADETGSRYFQLHELFVPLVSFESYLDEEVKKIEAKIFFPRVVNQDKL